MTLTTIEKVLKGIEHCNGNDDCDCTSCTGCPYNGCSNCIYERNEDIVKVLNACKKLYTETPEKASAVTYSVQSGPVTIHQKLLAVLQCVIQGEITDAGVAFAKELYEEFKE